MGVITATSKKHDKIKWSESIDTGLSLPTPAVLSLFTNIYYRMIISYLSYTLIIHRVQTKYICLHIRTTKDSYSFEIRYIWTRFE